MQIGAASFVAQFRDPNLGSDILLSLFLTKDQLLVAKKPRCAERHHVGRGGGRAWSRGLHVRPCVVTWASCGYAGGMWGCCWPISPGSADTLSPSAPEGLGGLVPGPSAPFGVARRPRPLPLWQGAPARLAGGGCSLALGPCFFGRGGVLLRPSPLLLRPSPLLLRPGPLLLHPRPLPPCPNPLLPRPSPLLLSPSPLLLRPSPLLLGLGGPAPSS